MKGITKIIGGLAIGTVNSALGAGGGMIAVPMLRKSGMEQNRAQANAVALIMLLTAASAGIYIYTGKVTFGDALPYLPAGLIGSVLGSFILPKIPTKILGKIFALFMLWAGVRMLMRRKRYWQLFSRVSPAVSGSAEAGCWCSISCSHSVCRSSRHRA